MQNVMQIATNAGHTAQNDGWTAQNDGRTAQNDGRNTLNVCQGPKGGLNITKCFNSYLIFGLISHYKANFLVKINHWDYYNSRAGKLNLTQ